jgi:hypothetical protein
MPRDPSDPDLPTSASGFGGQKRGDMSAPTGTNQSGGHAGAKQGKRPWDDPTGVAGRRGQEQFGDDNTSYFNLGARDAPRAAADPLSDPVVGWLIVVRGKGQGHILPIGYGNNSVGRGGTNRIALDFGDNGISRDVQFSIAYENKQRTFHLVPGSGASLTYLNGDLALQHQPLPARAIVRVGDTELMFVPLCSSEFDWHDVVAPT